jgi:hypothetical protein
MFVLAAPAWPAATPNASNIVEKTRQTCSRRDRRREAFGVRCIPALWLFPACNSIWSGKSEN